MKPLSQKQKLIVDSSPKFRLAFQIMQWFALQGKAGGTTEACALAIKRGRDSVSPRIPDLIAANCLVKTPHRRMTTKGRPAQVYLCPPGADFQSYLGLPRLPRTPKQSTLNPADTAMLDAARTYVSGRRRLKTEQGISNLTVHLLLALDRIASALPRSSSIKTE